MTLMYDKLHSRLALAGLIKPGGIGVELGVLNGAYSATLLENSKLDILVSIDAWRIPGFSDDNHFKTATNALAKFGNRSVILRSTFVKAAQLFPDGLFDFVYIDGGHTYENVKEDILYWWPKVKIGGLFAGHDYMNYVPKNSKNAWGVIKAVNEHIDTHSVKLYLTRVKEPIDARIPSWYCWKNG